MNRTLRAILCAALAAVLLLGLCACGKPDRPKSEPVYYENVLDYCLITHELDGTYKVRVINPSQKTVFERTGLSATPQLEDLGNGEVMLFYDHDIDILRNWAVVCNPESGYVSEVASRAMMVKGPYALYMDYLTNQQHVFVKDLREGGTYLEATTLTGIDVTNPDVTLKTDKDGKITANYKTMEDKKMSLEVKIPE